MLYETIGIVRTGSIAEVKEIVLTTGRLILRNGGVIRDVRNWGVFMLPKAISKHQQRHHRGHYFVMRYDAGIKTHEEVRRTLDVEPRMIRSASVKLGDGKLETMTKLTSIPWSKME
ncbi:ribosomal protein S6 [Apodospora peruviana]|uniref:Small ribosomal subunit protein bS6m n=1 Tax=Apodospora peruviana TaxID=516989 RepID=A0AAE0LZF1_9PEZI|nr:ribosomal protein S6 [Apodospora peruviana]